MSFQVELKKVANHLRKKSFGKKDLKNGQFLNKLERVSVKRKRKRKKFRMKFKLNFLCICFWAILFSKFKSWDGFYSPSLPL